MPIMSIAEMESLLAQCEERQRGYPVEHTQYPEIQKQIVRLRSSIAAAKERGKG